MKKPSIKTPGPDRSGLGDALSGGNRTGRSLLAAAAVLGVVFGIAQLRPPADPSAVAASRAASTAQVERTSLVCPTPQQGLLGTTALTVFSPAGGKGTGGSGTLDDVTPQAGGGAPDAVASSGAPSAAPSSSASASAGPSASASAGAAGSASPSAEAPAPAVQTALARLSLAKPGVPVTGTAQSGENAPGTAAVGTKGYAPGFAVSQTTTITEPVRAGLYGLDCTPAGTDFWLTGASTEDSRTDYISLVNADTVAATVDLRLSGVKGPIDAEDLTGITLAPGTAQALRLKSRAPAKEADLAVHVVVRGGRVAAALNASEEGKGGDWITASAPPAASQVLPGLPGDLVRGRLVVAAPSDDDADLKVQVSGKNGWFTPAGMESLHVKAGMVAALPFEKLTQGEVGAIRITPSDPAHPTPVVASVRVERENNGKTETAWISAAQPVGKRGSLAENRGGGATTVFLTATGQAAKVRLTASAGSGGGTPATKDVAVPAGTTVAVTGLEPAGLNGVYAVTAETLSGGPVVAARMLTTSLKDVPAFTVQGFRNDRSTVTVPYAQQDPGLLLR